jgi:hypothetical protein
MRDELNDRFRFDKDDGIKRDGSHRANASNLSGFSRSKRVSPANVGSPDYAFAVPSTIPVGLRCARPEAKRARSRCCRLPDSAITDAYRRTSKR